MLNLKAFGAWAAAADAGAGGGGLHPSKLHYDIGFAEFQGITEFMELRKSADILEPQGS